MRAAKLDEKPTPATQPQNYQKLIARVPLTLDGTVYPRGAEVPRTIVNERNGAHLLRTNSIEWVGINHQGPKPRKLPDPAAPMQPRPTGQMIRDIAAKQQGDPLARLRGTYREVRTLFDARKPTEVIRDLIIHATNNLFLDAQKIWVDANHQPYRRIIDVDAIWGDK
jgi:hypothetical protein